MNERKLLVAIVDDDPSIRDTTKDLLESAGLEAATFASAEAFLQSGDWRDVSCVMADMRMAGMSGMALHKCLAVLGRPLPIILMTAYPDERIRAHALRAGVIAYLTKPFSDEELLSLIQGVHHD